MIELLLFVVGLSVGSFLNVVIDRLPREESIAWGRSYCESCKKTLVWYDLIPVFSYFFLQGKCRYCRSSLSLQYPLVELLTGFAFAAIPFFVIHDNILYFGYDFFIVSCLLVISFIDIKYGIIPDVIVYPAIIVSALVLAASHALFPPYLLSALGAFLFFLFLFLVTRGKGMGFGDVKLVFMLGLFLGFPAIIISLYVAFLTGAVVSIILVVRNKLTVKHTIAFGPYLCLGALIAFLFKEQSTHLFLNLINFL